MRELRHASLSRPLLAGFDSVPPEGLAPGAVVRQLRELHSAFTAQSEPARDGETTLLFKRLVAVATSTRSDAEITEILADPVIEEIMPGLRRLSALGEFELERDWARRILDSPDPHAALAEYPYRNDYERLTRWEHHAATALTGAPLRRMLFIGAGPMPLSPLLLADHYDIEVEAIDIAPDATRLGAELARVFGVTGIEFQCSDVLNYEHLAGYDLVCLAALVGTEHSTKTEVLAHLRTHMDPGTLVLIRGAHSLHTLLYPDPVVDDLAGFTPVVVIHRYTDVANSLIIAQNPPSPPPASA